MWWRITCTPHPLYPMLYPPPLLPTTHKPCNVEGSNFILGKVFNEYIYACIGKTINMTMTAVLVHTVCPAEGELRGPFSNDGPRQWRLACALLVQVGHVGLPVTLGVCNFLAHRGGIVSGGVDHRTPGTCGGTGRSWPSFGTCLRYIAGSAERVGPLFLEGVVCGPPRSADTQTKGERGCGGTLGPCGRPAGSTSTSALLWHVP